jgi:thiamine pyrophosphokinase
MTVLIFANGEILDLEEDDWALPYFESATVIIAADGGARHLEAMQRTPDLVIGDLDSIDALVLGKWLNAGIRVIQYKAEKDETDLELAVKYAAELYTDQIVIFGGFGGRIDQSLGNILLLTHPALVGRQIKFADRYQEAFLIKQYADLKGAPGDIISLIPLKESVQISRTTGLKWQLDDESLELGLTRGISNVMISNEASIVIRSGLLLCIHISHLWDR